MQNPEFLSNKGGGSTDALQLTLLSSERPLGRPRRRWEDNIKMELQELGCGGMDWIDLAQDRGTCRALVRAVMNPRVP